MVQSCAIQMAARAAVVFLIALGLASCGGDLPGVISGSGSAPAISPDTPTAETKDNALPADEQLFQQGLRAFNEAEAAAQAGNATQAVAKYQEAIADFTESISAGPGGVYVDNAAYYLGRSYYEAGDLANAQSSLARFEAAYPQSVYLDNGRYYLGRSLFDAGLYSDALGPFERVLLSAGSIYEDDARFYHGRSFFHLGEYGAAITDFENLLFLFPASQYADNALLFEMRSFIAQADCVDAGTALARLASGYPQSTLITRAQDDFGAGCA